MRAKLLCLTCTLILAAFGGSALAGAGVVTGSGGPIQVMGNDLTVTKVCSGKTMVQVMGNHNTVTLTGECGDVSVMGNENTVVVEAAAKISVPGNGNTVTWERGVDGKDPKVSTLGTGNKVSKKVK